MDKAQPGEVPPIGNTFFPIKEAVDQVPLMSVSRRMAKGIFDRPDGGLDEFGTGLLASCPAICKCSSPNDAVAIDVNGFFVGYEITAIGIGSVERVVDRSTLDWMADLDLYLFLKKSFIKLQLRLIQLIHRAVIHKSGFDIRIRQAFADGRYLAFLQACVPKIQFFQAL